MLYIIAGFLLYIQSFAWQYKKSLFGLSIASFVIIFIIGGKYYNGWDWVNYQAYFSCTYQYSIEQCKDISSFEIGYIYLQKLIQYLGLSINYLYILISIINVYSLNKIIKKLNIQDWAIIYWIYFSLFGWVLWMQALRQGLAFSLVLLSLYFLFEHKKFKGIIFLFASLLFHLSSFIIIPFIVYYWFKQYLKNVLLLGILFSIVFLYFNFEFLGEKLENYLLVSSYIAMSPASTWLKYFLFLYIFIAIRKQKNSLLYCRENHLLYRLFIIGLILYPIFSLVSVLARFNIFFMPMGVLLFAQTKNINYKIIVINVAMLSFLGFISSIGTRVDLFPFNNYFIDKILLENNYDYDEQVYILEQKKYKNDIVIE